MRRFLVRAGVGVATGVLAAVLVGVSPASAHVTVSPSSATQGGYATLTFQVPNEKDNASTVQVDLNLPADTPLASVSIKPVAGWTATATRSKLDKPIKTDDGEVTEAVAKIVWKANSADTAIQTGQFQEFQISAGPLPDTTDKIVFKVLQTYSDGDVARWIDEPTDNGQEPDHPAPVVKLVKGDDEGGPATGDTAKGGGDGTGRANLALGFGIAALVLAIAGVVLGGLAWRRRGAAS